MIVVVARRYAGRYGHRETRIAMAHGAPSADGLTEAQRRALAEFSALLSAHGEVPRRLIVVDAEGQETEVSPVALDDLLPAVAVAARVLAEELADDRELSTTQA